MTEDGSRLLGSLECPATEASHLFARRLHVAQFSRQLSSYVVLRKELIFEITRPLLSHLPGLHRNRLMLGEDLLDMADWLYFPRLLVPMHRFLDEVNLLLSTDSERLTRLQVSALVEFFDQLILATRLKA